MPGEGSRRGLHVLAHELLTDPADPADPGTEPAPAAASGADAGNEPDDTVESRASGSLLGGIVDVVVGARRLAGWALWLQLAAVAHLVSRWQSSPPIVEDAFPAPADPASPPGLAERLWRLVDDIEVWGSVETSDLAEAFVASEIAAAAGLSHYGSGQVVDAARTLFMTTRLPRTRHLLRAGLLDWNKLRTVLTATRDLDDEVAALVEAAVISDADLAVADPLDALADPTRPGSLLPPIARMNNPTLRAQLHAATAAIDAEAAAKRAAKARQRRAVYATPLADAMGRLELTTGQEQVAAILAGLDQAVATAKHHGDARTPDQIRCDQAVHLLTGGIFGTDAFRGARARAAGESGRAFDEATPRPDGGQATASAGGQGRTSEGGQGPTSDGGQEPTSGGDGDGRQGSCGCGSRRRGDVQVRLTVPLSTWLELAEEPAVLDGYGAVPAAIARQIAADAARDHPGTTTWRCVVVGDKHRTVLGVGDVIPTPRHDPTVRQATFARTAEPYCVFPGCRVQARRCDLDHRIPYDHAHPDEGGATCTCNLQPLCRRHHRLRTAGLITPRLLTPPDGDDDSDPPTASVADDGDLPTGTVRWTTMTGRTYEHRPPAATPAPADRHVVAACAAVDARRRAEDEAQVLDEVYDENTALSHWERTRQELADREAARATRGRSTSTTIKALGDEPPF